MDSDLKTGSDHRANHSIDLLRGGAGSLPLEDVTALPGDIRLLADPALHLSGQVELTTDGLLEIDARMTGTGEWFGLHLPLGAPDLSEASSVGFLCRSAAPAPHRLQIVLRAGHEAGFTDHFFDKFLVTHSRPATHLDLLSPTHMPELPRQAAWYELVLFLPVQDFRWVLSDLRVFIL